MILYVNYIHTIQSGLTNAQTPLDLDTMNYILESNQVHSDYQSDALPNELMYVDIVSIHWWMSEVSPSPTLVLLKKVL